MLDIWWEDVDTNLASAIFGLLSVLPLWEKKATEERAYNTTNQKRTNNTLSVITTTFHGNKPKGAQHCRAGNKDVKPLPLDVQGDHVTVKQERAGR